MEALLDNLGPLALVIAALLGAGFLKKFKNNKALDKHVEAKGEIEEIEGAYDAVMKDIEAEREFRKKMKESMEKEQGREISDEELNDFFDKRYDN